MTTEFIINRYYIDNNLHLESQLVLGPNCIFDYIGRQGKNAIDIGCGSGVYTKQLSGLCENVIGVDIRKSAIDYAKTYNNSANISYIYGNFMKLEFDNNSVDIVFSTNCFYHIKNKEELLKKIYNMLKIGGIFIFSDLTDRSKQVMGLGSHYISVQKYINLLQHTGFTNVTFIKEENKVIDGVFTGLLCSIYKCNK